MLTKKNHWIENDSCFWSNIFKECIEVIHDSSAGRVIAHKETFITRKINFCSSVMKLRGIILLYCSESFTVSSEKKNSISSLAYAHAYSEKILIHDEALININPCPPKVFLTHTLTNGRLSDPPPI